MLGQLGPVGLGMVIILASLRWKLTRSPFYVREWGRNRLTRTVELLGIGLVQLTCLALYLIRRPSVLGICAGSPAISAAPSRRHVRMANLIRARSPHDLPASSGWDSTPEPRLSALLRRSQRGGHRTERPRARACRCIATSTNHQTSVSVYSVHVHARRTARLSRTFEL